MGQKAKTRKIVAKRFKVTKNGIILRGRQNARHLRSNKTKSQIRRLKKPTKLSKTMVRSITAHLPYQ